ncbi:MAG: hypothetical protein ACO1O4_14775 [Devosia sp.]
MERRSQVLTADVEFEGEMHSASYYVENDIIHAHIGGRLVATPKGDVPAEALVRAMLQGYLLQRQRKARQRISWTKA